MVPEGSPRVVGAETVDVKITVSPKLEGFREEARVIMGVAFPTTCETAEDVEVEKLVSPLYTAVMEWVLTERLKIANVATPPTPTVEEPSVVAPSLKVTVPVGVPAPVVTETVAVKVTDCP